MVVHLRYCVLMCAGVEADEARVAVAAATKYAMRPVQHLSTQNQSRSHVLCARKSHARVVGDASESSFLVTFPNPLAFVHVWSMIDLEALRAIRPIEFIHRCWDGVCAPRVTACAR